MSHADSGVKQGRSPRSSCAYPLQLRDASAQFYGTAGRAFLARLVATRADDPDGFYALVKGLRQQFITTTCPPDRMDRCDRCPAG